MKRAIESALTTLRARGYRITDARTEIVTVLTKCRVPVTIQELTERVSVDEATVYRTISLLGDEGIVEEIAIQNDATHYALADGHHHHLVCVDCGYIEHIPCDDTLRVPQRSSFSTITHHEVTFYGVCMKCA